MEATAAEASAAAAVASAAPPSQLAYYAVHESAITSALDACVTDTMEKQPADPVLDDVQVALNYSKENDHRVIFKIVTHGFMERGAPLQWLSAFPGESEFLYPPLTYLKPTGVEETFDIEGVHITALEVVASM